MIDRNTRRVLIVMACSAIGSLALAGGAEAERKGAPIIYAGAGDAASQPARSTPISANAIQITDKNTIAFEYPGAQRQAIARPSQPIAQPTADQSIPTLDLTSKPSQPIRIAATETQSNARSGMPLTLSRVRADRNAEISDERGRAGIYMDGFDGQPTANGEIFDEAAMTAAHPSLPLPSLVQVINEDTSREVVVRVNDRGPFDGKRILELSPRAGEVLGISKGSSANVRLRYLGPAPVKQNDENYASIAVDEDVLPPVRVATRVATQEAPRRIVSPAPMPVYQPSTPVRVESVAVVQPVVAGNVYIQAGSFADISNAQRLTLSLGQRVPVKIEEARVNGGDYFRVLIGPFSNRGLAEQKRRSLSQSQGVDGFITER